MKIIQLVNNDIRDEHPSSRLLYVEWSRNRLTRFFIPTSLRHE